MKLVKQNKYKGSLKTKILKGVLSLGLVGSMMFSLSACNDKEEVKKIDIDKIDYQVVFIKDLNNDVQSVVLDPNSTPIVSAIYNLREYSTCEDFCFDYDFRLKQNWKNIVEAKTGCKYVDTVDFKPLIVTEYGYKKIYTKDQIDELVAKIKQEPNKYLPEQDNKEEDSKVKTKAKSTE